MTASATSRPATAGQRPVMSLRGIRKSFGPVHALRGVDLDIRAGEVHAVVGENGAGKSTLIAIAAGVLRPDAGTVEIDAGDAKPNPPLTPGVAVAFQHPALAGDLSVLENLQLAAPWLSGPGGREEVERLLARVVTDEIAMPIDRRVAMLSLAQRHAVEIARALAARPRVIFFDEPTEPFQQAEIRKLFDLINELRRDGLAIVYVSHRLHEVTELADRISVMRDGSVIDTRAAGEISDAEIVTLIAGRPLGQVFPAKAAAVGAPLLEARGLGGAGFSDVDFTARAGEIVGLAGVEGEGQREFLRALAGLGSWSEGTLTVKGHSVSGTSPAGMRRTGVGFVPEDRHEEGLFLALSIRENLAIGSLGQVSRNGVVDRTAEATRAAELIRQLRVRAPSAETTVSDLSGGNQQKVLIGREMGAGPAILLVDEPTKGVDVGSRAEIYQRLRSLADDGLAIVVCSSDGIELEGLCDRVLIFARGQIVRELTGGAVTDASITEANLTATVARADRREGAVAERPWRRLLASDHFPAAILAVLVAVVLVATQLASPYFLSAFNIGTMLAFLAIVTFISMAQGVTILVGGIDLSVGALAGFVVVLASFLAPSGASDGLAAGGALLILVITTVYGLFQGWLITAIRIPAIIVTLASFVGLQGLSLSLRPQAGGVISDLLSEVPQFPIVGIPAGMVLALLVVAGFEWILYRRALGRRLRAVGSSPLASHRLGIHRDRHVLLAFGLSGLFTGIAGLMLAGQVGIGSPATGIDYTLMSITAVVLGGASVAGGRVSMLCTFVGGALVQAISSASSFVNSDSSVHYTVLGLVTLLAAIFFSVARLRRRQAAPTGKQKRERTTMSAKNEPQVQMSGHMPPDAPGGGGAARAKTMPKDSGAAGRRVLIKGGAVLSMDPKVGDFPVADVLVEGSKIVGVGPNLNASGADVIDASGMIVMPGFIDTHHHQFETALRSFLADGILVNDGQPHGVFNYYEYILQKFSMVYRPEDIYINEVFASLSQIDAGVTTVMDVSQIHHSPEHSDAVVKALRDGRRRAVFGYFEGWGDRSKYPADAERLRKTYFSSDDQLTTMVMGGEIYIPGYENSWKIGRELGLPIAMHIVGTFGMSPTFDQLAEGGQFGPDLIFIHMTGMSDLAWKIAADQGARLSLSVPIEMTMRHGLPPIQKALDLGMQPSLSSDVECTMTSDFFTQMRMALTLQRSAINDAALAGKTELPELLTSRDVIRFATIEGARCLGLEKKTGSLTPGKEADILLLDATAINVAPLNHVPGAVVTLMERSNVDTVMVGGKIQKWAGQLLDVDLPKLRRELEASRDYVFKAAGVERDLFRQ